MTFVFVLIALGVLAAIGLLATGRLGELPEAERQLRPAYLGDAPEFDVVVRGYRMDEVDSTIDLLTAQIADLKSRKDD